MKPCQDRAGGPHLAGILDVEEVAMNDVLK